jgi:hypothetical protein
MPRTLHLTHLSLISCFPLFAAHQLLINDSILVLSTPLVLHRLFKVPGRLEDLCEDYGQVAVYKGTLPGHSHSYALDDHHK